jgi:energy-coupling factor transporter ATP-binding protein EcfA2
VRLKHIALTWFRGAAEHVALETQGKSVVVYGPNGAGKSSFVDGVEYLVSGGKIGHLSNEYSGRRLENSIINTQMPERMQAGIELQFADNTTVSAAIRSTGAVTYSGAVALRGWQRERVILRQDEVSAFVQADKAEKYSSILPLIGLGPLELVATNIRSLRRRIASEFGVQRDRGALAELERKWNEAGISTTEAGVLVKALHSRFLPETEMPERLDSTVAALRPVIEARIRSASVETRQHMLLATTRDLDLHGLLSAAVSATEITSILIEPLLSERLAVLIAAEAFVTKVDGTASVTCPSCGQSVEPAAFRFHVETEKKRLEGALAAFAARERTLTALLDGLQSLHTALGSDDLREWNATEARNAVRDNIRLLFSFDIAAVRSRSDNIDLGKLSEILPPVIDHIRQATSTAPPEAKDLLAASKLIDAVAAHPRIRQLRTRLEKVDGLLAFLDELEGQVRDEIRLRTEGVISGISIHIQRMWNRLHPAYRVDGIRLYQPVDTAKAIDIELSFYGRTQASPRLSLSEGDRHSLGLCLFLSLAKEGGGDRPLLLDDIVTSLDREHRSNVADLLVAEFSDRQVLLFTHEDEWFIELKHRLPAGQWQFKTLLPFDAPVTGIRWSGAPHGFANARVLLDIDPKSAANSVRGLMDLHMALVAERLELPVPFLRGARNDRRNALELLERFISRSPTQLRRRVDGGQHLPWDGPIAAARDLKSLLTPWGNAGSHGRYLTRSEAERLIDACETFLASLSCTECETHISHANVADRHQRCDCDRLRWKI